MVQNFPLSFGLRIFCLHSAFADRRIKSERMTGPTVVMAHYKKLDMKDFEPGEVGYRGCVSSCEQNLRLFFLGAEQAYTYLYMIQVDEEDLLGSSKNTCAT
jgi:hypothetical protein